MMKKPQPYIYSDLCPTIIINTCVTNENMTMKIKFKQQNIVFESNNNNNDDDYDDDDVKTKLNKWYGNGSKNNKSHSVCNFK